MKQRFSAYELTSAKAATAVSLRGTYYAPAPHAIQTAHRIREALGGDCCYAFHCKAVGLIKLGRTTNLFQRWAKLEMEGGRPLQLVAVWQTDNSRTLERTLHEQFAEHRQLGEWFDAEPILSMLKNVLEPQLATLA